MVSAAWDVRGWVDTPPTSPFKPDDKDVLLIFGGGYLMCLLVCLPDWSADFNHFSLLHHAVVFSHSVSGSCGL